MVCPLSVPAPCWPHGKQPLRGCLAPECAQHQGEMSVEAVTNVSVLHVTQKCKDGYRRICAAACSQSFARLLHAMWPQTLDAAR